MRNRWPSDVAEPTEKVPVRSGSSSSASVAGPFLLRATRARVASISGSPSSARLARVERLAGYRGQALLDVAAVRSPGGHRPALPAAARLAAGQVAAGFQVVGQALRLVERPGLEGGHELALVDDPV